MRQENDTTRVLKSTAIVASLGFAAGFITSFWIQKHQTLASDDILEKVKQAFLQEGPIEGSWIQMEKQAFQKFAIKSKVYTGGITRFEDDEIVQYEFIADAYTGTIIDIYRL